MWHSAQASAARSSLANVVAPPQGGGQPTGWGTVRRIQEFSIPSELIPADAPPGALVKRDAGRAIHYAGNLMQWKLEQEQSMGLCSVVEVVMRRGEEPPLHVHANEDELYYVLEGDLTFYVGHDVFDVSPRDTVLLPRNVPHAFSVSKRSGVARLLLVIWPSNNLRRYFDMMGTRATEPELPPPAIDFPVAEAVDALAPHGVSILGPGPSLVNDGLAPPQRPAGADS
jgi:quercetin dioxygenase-like cupin family protein